MTLASQTVADRPPGWLEDRMPFGVACLLSTMTLLVLAVLMLAWVRLLFRPAPEPIPPIAIRVETLAAAAPPVRQPAPQAPPPAALAPVDLVVPVAPEASVAIVPPERPRPRSPRPSRRTHAEPHVVRPVTPVAPAARPVVLPPASAANAADAPRTTAPAAPAAPAAKDSLEARIRAAVQAALHYPAAARMMGDTGTTLVGFTYRDRAISEEYLARSSGIAILDRAAIATVRDAAAPPPPPELRGTALRLVVEVRFRAVDPDDR